MSSSTPTPAQESCACADIENKPVKRGVFTYLRDIFKKAAVCACSGSGGFVAGHAGCIIAPIVVAATATSAVGTAGASALAVAFGAAVTAGGLYLWHKMRGRQAGVWEKRVVIGSAISGLALSAGLQMTTPSAAGSWMDDICTSRNVYTANQMAPAVSLPTTSATPKP